MTHQLQHRWRRLALAAAVVALGACSSTSDADEAEEQARAEELVAATQEAGVAPRLTVEAAESLYGTDAATVCEAFEGGTTTSAELLLFGNAAQGRRKAITEDAVTYAGLVVQTYCPDELDHFNEAVADLDPFETS